MESVQHFTQSLIDEYLKGPPNEEFENSMMNTLFQDQNYDLILSALEGGFKLTPEIKELILQSGNVQLYQYLHAQDQLNLNYEIMRIAVTSGQLDTIQWLRMMGCPWQKDLMDPNDPSTPPSGSVTPEVWNIELFILATQSCKSNIDLVIWFFENGSPFQKNKNSYMNILRIVIAIGNLEVIKYFYNKNSHYGYDWNEKDSDLIFIVAAAYGHLEILKWALNGGCPLNKNIDLYEWTCIAAAKKGQLKIIKYLQSISASFRYEWNNYLGERLYQYAWPEHQHEIMQWLKEIGTPIPRYIYLHGIKIIPTWNDLNWMEKWLVGF